MGYLEVRSVLCALYRGPGPKRGVYFDARVIAPMRHCVIALSLRHFVIALSLRHCVVIAFAFAFATCTR